MKFNRVNHQILINNEKKDYVLSRRDKTFSNRTINIVEEPTLQ